MSRAAGAVLGLLLGGVYVLYAWTGLQGYEKLEALNLPGAHRLRLEPTRAAALRELVTQANASCTTLVTAPGMLSFYFWTGLPVPSLLDYETWIIDMNDAEQEALADDLSRVPHVCVIYNQEAISIWTLGEKTFLPSR